MYPKTLRPTELEIFEIDGKTIEIPKCILILDKWSGEPVKETFGGKPIVSFGNKPMFAELAIMNHFVNDGWEARWIETYGKGKNEPIYLREWKDDKYINQQHSRIENKEVKLILAGIAKNNYDSYSGCWDILGWKEGKVLFAESKRNKKDKVRESQNKWLGAALKYGLTADDFLIVQWDFK